MNAHVEVLHVKIIPSEMAACCRAMPALKSLKLARALKGDSTVQQYHLHIHHPVSAFLVLKHQILEVLDLQLLQIIELWYLP